MLKGQTHVHVQHIEIVHLAVFLRLFNDAVSCLDYVASTNEA